jgi:hypothetical protein
MSRKILVITAVLLFPLFSLPAGADTAAPQPDPEAVTIEVARDAEADTSRATVMSAKRAESLGTDDTVDCFYEENRYRRECDRADSGKR